MTAPAELKQLGRYDLTRVLGKGAMGIVYEGMDPKLHRKVAIKTILKGHMDDDDAAKEYSMRFMREAQAVACWSRCRSCRASTTSSTRARPPTW